MTTNTEIEMQSLAASLEPLINHFNAHQSKLRVLAVLSPACQR